MDIDQRSKQEFQKYENTLDKSKIMIDKFATIREKHAHDEDTNNQEMTITVAKIYSDLKN